MYRIDSKVLALALGMLVAGCGGGGGAPVVSGGGGGGGGTGGGGGGVLPPGALPMSRYDMANGCFMLKSLRTAAAAFAVRKPDGSYAATSADTTGAEPLFMKPTALGSYMIYSRDTSNPYMTESGSPAAVGSGNAPGTAAEWTIDTIPATPVPATTYGDVDYTAAFAGDGTFTIYSAAAGKYVAVDSSQNLVLEDLATAGDAAKWGFAPFPGCTAYPEAGLNATGTAFTSPTSPVLGFADVHQHFSATDFLGGAHYGKPFDRFGITEALKDCSGVHGSNGQADAVGNFLANDPTGSHDTVGWPTFNDWPSSHRLTHEATYYVWIQRAYMAGLRLVLNNLVENQMLCKLESNATGGPPANNPSCNEMTSARNQAAWMHSLQDYIDAQSGGPGKGWFRIVTDPAAARSVISKGKMAVVLGIEISHIFNCKLTDAGTGVESANTYGDPTPNTCTTTSIDADLADLHALGVRQMFPIHEFNNALGGNGIFDGFVLNVGNKSDTGQYWQTYDCPAVPYFFDAGAKMTSVPPGPEAPDGSPTCYIAGTPGGATQCYPPNDGPHQCNLRTMTPTGEYAISRVMDYRMILEVDHLELKLKDQVMDMATSRASDASGVKYPAVSSHGGHGGISIDQVQRLYGLGGYVYDHQGNGVQYLDRLTKLRAALGVTDPGIVVAMGTGDDTNGLAGQSGPPAAAAQITYPFTLFTGTGDWSDPIFSGAKPIKFDKEVTGTHVFDYNLDGTNSNGTDLGGVVHYGLVADWVEDVRQQGHKAALKALFTSAERYLQVWEQTLNRPDRRNSPLYTQATLPPIPNPDCHYGGTCP